MRFISKVVHPYTGDILWEEVTSAPVSPEPIQPKVESEENFIPGGTPDPKPTLGFRFSLTQLADPETELEIPNELDPTPTPAHPRPHILDSDWTKHCGQSNTWNEVWSRMADRDLDWLINFEMREGKVYQQGKLCIPGTLIFPVLLAPHNSAGHMGFDKLYSKPKRHGVMLKGEEHLIWVGRDVPKKSETQGSQVSPVNGDRQGKGFEYPLEPASTNKKSTKRALELFKGTGSVGCA